MGAGSTTGSRALNLRGGWLQPAPDDVRPKPDATTEIAYSLSVPSPYLTGGIGTGVSCDGIGGYTGFVKPVTRSATFTA
jgi:hypothetical protein